MATLRRARLKCWTAWLEKQGNDEQQMQEGTMLGLYLLVSVLRLGGGLGSHGAS